MVKITEGFLVVARKLQEIATDLSHADIRTRLSGALSEHDSASHSYSYICDVFGDDKSGDVVYSCAGDLMKAPYSLSQANGKQTTTINFEAAVDVVPRTTYEAEADGDELAATAVTSTASGFEAKRKKEGKGKESNQASSQRQRAAGVIELNESAATLEPIVLKEARADYPIKLIAPGKGSSAFYPAEVLQRDGPKVFTKGTHVYLNHPTQTEESERPEGDVKNLAGVLTTDAVYQEAGKQGAGLYASMKVFADHAQLVEEKAPYVGMSIRASGRAESNKTRDGLPVLTELTRAESVDVVTHAGAGGMILTEAARGAQSEEEKMDFKQQIQEALAPVYTRQRRDDARAEASRLLEGVTLPDLAKSRIVERVVDKLDVSKDVDSKALRESVLAEAKAEGEYLGQITGSGRVVGMGISEAQPPTLSKKERKAFKETRKQDRKDAVAIFESLGMPEDAAKIAARGRVA